MEKPVHFFSDLFEQLGLSSDSDSIEQFIKHHRPLPADMELAEAPCWNEGQAEFLREAIEDDADWAELVDHLDVAMHQDN
ncbi:DUF2789 domain-containing protein [Vreelandella populi]|uniref:DUF2789 domain-containing protein n=1 Tax=Vreelandella populi TaxID=2498858 RepID=A0A433LGL7_9GAMM|nr:DUF2789 domain-containing protein [Halomonas populi]RUR40684.1 DUF2789 domain-containing protein [Halomonas populi]RUR49190.1 DUF2789 domain-containing protein [Halomonas populi]